MGLFYPFILTIGSFYSRPCNSPGPATWSSATQALQALKTGKYEGIGFVFTPTDPFTGTGLDHCLRQDGSLEPWAQEIVAALNSYTEYSPSGTGLHILTQARLPEGGRRRENTEMYESGRYFTLTGNHLTGTPRTIEQRQTEQMQVYEHLAPREQTIPLPVFSHSQAYMMKKPTPREVLLTTRGEPSRTPCESGRDTPNHPT